MLPGLQHVPAPGVVRLDPDQHVGLQRDPLAGASRLGTVAILAERPLARYAAVIESWLADELDLDAPLEALDGPHEHMLGVLVGRRASVRRDRVLATARAHRQRVTDDCPSGRRLPGGDQRVRPGFVGPVARHVDPERAEPEGARAPVEKRSKHTRRVKPRHAQPIDRSVRRNERPGVAVRQERIVSDRGKRRRRRGAPLASPPAACSQRQAGHRCRTYPAPACSSSPCSSRPPRFTPVLQVTIDVADQVRSRHRPKWTKSLLSS